MPDTAAPAPIEQLRAAVAAMSVRGASDHRAFGVDQLDARIIGGGLAVDAVHEVTSASMSLADDAAGTLFIAGAAARYAADAVGPVLWATTGFDLYAPGLAQAGLAAARIIYAEARDDDEVLAILEDAVRDGTPAAVVGEVRRAFMIATRRLQLVAADRGVPVLLRRRWRRAGADPLAEPSAAITRWRIGCAPSHAVEAGLPRARWTVELARQRGGEPFSLVLEACDDEGRLAVPVPVGRGAAPAADAVRAVA